MSGTTGRRCEQCSAVGVPSDDTLCRACRIGEDEGEEAKRRYLREIGKRGGEASRRGRGLSEAELGPLQDHQDAERWCRKVAIAAAVGRLGSSRANVILRAVRQWSSAREGRLSEEKIEKLEQKLRDLEARGAV